MPITAIRHSLLLLLLLLLTFYTHLKISNGFSDFALNPLEGGEIDAIATRVCDGKLGGRPAMAEIEVDSEVNRRFLAEERKYISYETLRRDVVPCSTPGSSYYSCGASPANHYSRGCSVITQCARF